MIAWLVGPVNGGSPVSISYNTHPSPYTSLRPSSARSPAACSGLMYAGVPSTTPVRVRLTPPAASSAPAMPKSATIASPPDRRMFSGLTSRWMTSWLWAKLNALATSRVIDMASSMGSWCSRVNRSRSDSPSTYGMT